MRRGVLVGLGVAGVAAVGLSASRALGSRPDEPGYPGPLPTCGDVPNCYRARVRLAADPEAVRAAAFAGVRSHGDWFTGRAVRVAPTDDGLAAVFKAGPFRDDVAVAVEAVEGGGSVLHVRSASRVGENDLGVNRRRARRLVDEIRRALAL